MDINYINELLKQGKTVKEIRGTIGYTEKRFQKEVKSLGYKFDQKIKQYINNDTGNNVNDIVKVSDFNSNTLSNTTCNTDIIDNADKENLNFIGENINLLKEMLMYYKRNKESNTNNNGIVIDLIDDKNMKNDNPKSIRVNYFIWNEWKEFTDKSNFSSKDLVSMALKNYMEKYK